MRNQIPRADSRSCFVGGRAILVALLLAALFDSTFSGLVAQQTIKRKATPRVQQQARPDQNRIRMAQDYERRGNYVGALRIYQNLLQQVPSNQLYYEGVKRNLLRLKRFDELLGIIKSQMAARVNVKYYADMGGVYYKQGLPDDATMVWQEAVARFANQKPSYTYIANAMIANRLYDDAIQVYLQGRTHFKQQTLFVFELANIYVIRLKYKEATREYLTHLAHNPNQFSYIEGRIVNYTKDSETARSVADILSEALPNHKQKYLVRKLMADLYLRIEDFAHAMEQFQILETMEPPPNLKRKNESGRELFFFGEKALKAEEFSFAEQSFNLIVEKYPRSQFTVQALFGLAQARKKQGMPAQALQKLEELVAIDNRSTWGQEAMFLIGEIYFNDLFDLDKALQAYDAITQKHPRGKRTNQAYVRIGDCHAARGEFEDAQKWYARSTKMLPAGSALRDQAEYQTAYLNFLTEDYDTALESLTSLTDDIGAEGRNQDFVNDALELMFLIEENRASSEPALKLYGGAQRFKLQKIDAKAISALENLLATYPQSGVADEALLELADLENRRGDHHKAIDHLTGLLQQHPESVFNALAQKRIGEIYELAVGDSRKAYDAYEKVLVNYPNSLYVEEVRLKLRSFPAQKLNN